MNPLLRLFRKLLEVCLLLSLGQILAGVPVLDVEGGQHALEVALVRQPGVVMALEPYTLVVVLQSR